MIIFLYVGCDSVVPIEMPRISQTSDEIAAGPQEQAVAVGVLVTGC